MNLEPSRQTKKTKPQAPASKPAKTAATSKPAKTAVTSRPASAVTSTAVRTRQRVSPCEDLQALIAKRAYELYCERGFREGCALDDWLEAEREILSQIPPV